MKTKKIYLVFGVLLLLSIFSYFNTFENIENSLEDRFFQHRSKVDTRIVIVAIDDPSLEVLGQWPWPRDYHGRLIEILNEGNAAVIGLDIMFPEKARDPGEDLALVQRVEKAGNVIVPIYGSFSKYTPRGNMEALEIVEPFEELKDAAIGAHINTFPDPDGIVRQALLTFNYQGKEIKSFSWEIYREYLKAQHSSEISLPPIDDWNRFYIDFVGEPGDFEHLSYYQVLNGEIPSQYFEEKIVLIGPYAPGLEDYYFTPLDHQTPMYGVEVHANILQNFLYGKYKRSVPDVINILMVLAFGMGVYGGFKKFTASRVFIILLITLSSYIYLAQGLYQQGWRVFLFYPILAGLVLYFLMLGYSYLEEILERKRVTNVFGRYVAPQVVNQILSAGEEGLRLGGARREISVLFVDIRGFTPLAEKAQPEEVVAILNEYLDLCAQAIFKYEGTLDKFIGDAAMAIFNAPLDVKDHAFRAVQAAWAIKEGSKDLEDKLLAQYGRSISFGIGINTGYAVVGNIGSETRMDYTAIGDTVNIGARLESNAKPGQILLSQATYDLVKEKVMVTELGKIKVKGKEQGIFAYQLEGLR